MGYVGRNNIYEATIKRMVTQALEKQEQEFLEAHSTDADEQLLAYLRQSAVRLGHTPWPKEIVGGSFIEQRFGSWQNALQKAQLPMPSTFGKVTGFARYQAETERQKVLYREKKAAKKLRAKQRLAEQAKRNSLFDTQETNRRKADSIHPAYFVANARPRGKPDGHAFLFC